MVEEGNLSSFNKARIRDISECNDALVSIIFKEKKSFPLIFLLLTQTTEFYSRHFPELHNKIKREKRLVVFETPSRVQMTHEYTIEGTGDMKHGFYFLFNAIERLNWLKVYLEGIRISIASKEKVISLLKDKLADELDKLETLLNETKDLIVYRLYDLSDGKPCFVEFNQKECKGQQSLLLSITFFDSIQNKARRKGERMFSPLQEKCLIYNYNTLSNSASSWIYFKAPSNFVLSVKHYARASHIETSMSNDEEISAYVLTPKGQRLDVKFDIFVNVPGALKWWYNALFYLSIAIVTISAALSIYSIGQSVGANWVEKINNISLAVAAALIATRGWLMSEEQVMKRISKWYTLLIILLLALPICPFSGSNHEMLVRIVTPENESGSEVIDTLYLSDHLLDSDIRIECDEILEVQNNINN